ncbi:hypothetical protein DMH01_14990 [Amycolatopsis sp. WAC 04182]|uniref:hypothetical protein n=1 Tax=Amycolatopsis sp. WAC 04182 TaxID=2203198 RepID=UPI000F78237A|nr:hypothetical protein [Amycolatopsis sp. WAC 04182]RSN60603.1 hypothetical protein DMH01_14990 [Amycolatopsis sp. WAC 04182]
MLSAVGEDRRDHVFTRQVHRDRRAIAVALAADLFLERAVTIQGGRLAVADGQAVARLAEPCGLAVRATLSRVLPIDDMLAELEGPAYTVAWTALQRANSARKVLFRGWAMDPEATFLWHRMLASAHQDGDTADPRAAVLWMILSEAGLHRDQLRSPSLQPRSACLDGLGGLLLPRHEHRRRTPFRQRQHH